MKELLELSFPNLFPPLLIVFTAGIGTAKVTSSQSQSLQPLSLNHFHALHSHPFKAPRGTKVHVSHVFQLRSVSPLRRRTSESPPLRIPLARRQGVAAQSGGGRRCLSKVGDDTPSRVSFLPSNPLLSRAHAERTASVSAVSVHKRSS